ncbi:MAG TPA: hypothetical protein ENJ51_10870 [Leucothrix mucor]|uniref:Polyketide cyclase n=1 Tax=Leucothrix mucor TaxID=45248 RepID=A0A7V2T1B1_LEUMU|nr:hypothetical protein [Leucothrix mucor]
MLHKITIFFFLFLLSINTSFAASLNESKVNELIDSYLDAWKTRDIAEIGKLYAKNISVYDLPTDSTIKGKEAVLKFEQEAWLASAPDMVWIRTSPAFITGNTVAYEWVYSGTYTGDWWGTKITNKPFSVKGISTTTFNDDGKIILQKDFYDLKSFEKQLGV